MAFVRILSQMKLLFALLVVQLVWYIQKQLFMGRRTGHYYELSLYLLWSLSYNHAKIQINMLNFLYRVWSLPYNNAKFQINMLNLLYILSGHCHIIMPKYTYTEHSKLSCSMV